MANYSPSTMTSNEPATVSVTATETSPFWSTARHVTTTTTVTPESVTSSVETTPYSNFTYDPFDLGDGLTVHPHWRSFDIFGLPEIYHYAIGVYVTIVCLVGVFGNVIAIWVFTSVKSLRTPPNLFIINVAISDGIFSLVNGFPLWSISSFTRRWVFGRIGCVAYGFIGGLTGFVSINTLAFIAMDRYYVIARPFSAMKNITHRRAAIQIAFIWLWSLAWSGPPLLGWGEYILEGFQTTCTFDYLTRTAWNMSFVFSLFSCGFLAPVLVIVVCYVNIVLAVSSQNKTMAKKTEQLSAKEKKDQKKSKQEIQLAKTAAITISLFVTSWVPYASIALLGVTGYAQYVTPVTAVLPNMFAKASAIYNPILYALTHPKFRRALHERIPCLFLCCPNINRGDKSESSAHSQKNSQNGGAKAGKEKSKKEKKKDGGTGGAQIVRQSTRDSDDSEVSVLDDTDSIPMSNVSHANAAQVSSHPAGRSAAAGKSNRASKKIRQGAPASSNAEQSPNPSSSPTNNQQNMTPQVMIVNPSDPRQYPVHDPNMQPPPGQQPYIMYYPPYMYGPPGQTHPASPQHLPPMAQMAAPPGMMPPYDVYTVPPSPEAHNYRNVPELQSHSDTVPPSESRDSGSHVQETSFNGNLDDKNRDDKKDTKNKEGICNEAFEQD